MLEIRNRSSQPVTVPLPRGKTLHLGPGKVAQVADNATQHPGLLELVKQGVIEILGEKHSSGGMRESRNAARQPRVPAKSPFRRGHGER